METAKIRNATQISKTESARLISIAGTETWVPLSVINAINPAQRTVEIETWWLIKNNIAFKI